MGMHLRLDLSLGGRVLGGGVPTPAVPEFDTIVIEGDSITSNTPSTYDAGFYSYQYDDFRSDKAIEVRAQGSRVVGSSGNLNDNGNSLFGKVSEDAAYSPDLITYMIGANDFTTGTDAAYRTNLIALRAAYASARPSMKIAWSGPIAYNPTGTPHPLKANFDTQRASLLPAARDPAVWGQWADYYLPMGEHPDFADPATAGPLFGDAVHPSAAGQTLLFNVYKAAMDTLLDPTRVNSSTLYDAAWLTSESSLTAGQTITRRMIVSGLKWTGHSGGINVTGDGSPSVKVGGVAGPAAYAYNGDIVDLTVTVSSTPLEERSVNLTIGGETRTITFTAAAAVTPVAVTSIYLDDVIGSGATHDHTVNFTTAGRYLLLATADTDRAATTLTYDPAGANLAATKQTHSIGAFANSISAFIVDVPTTGSKTVRIEFGGFVSQSSLSALLIENADSTLVAVSPATAGTAPSNESDPHETAAGTVPANGLFVGGMAVLELLSVDPETVPTVHTGTTLIIENVFPNAGQGQRSGQIVGKRGAGSSVKLGFNYKFGNYGRVGLIFKANGT